MKHAFLILASGKSSRLNGFPKTFCKVNGKYIAQSSVDTAGKYFDKTYLVLNNEIYPEYKDAVKGCTTLAIDTGNGDAHSFLKAARLIREDCGADYITLCWGDSYYLGDSIFKLAHDYEPDSSIVGVSYSSIDKEPYAWYDTKDNTIYKSHFRNSDGVIESGLHDQSVFTFDLLKICSQLEEYMKYLGLDDSEEPDDVKAEMKLLNAFTYFYENDMLPMSFKLVEPGQCYSFNTNEELDNIVNIIKNT